METPVQLAFASFASSYRNEGLLAKTLWIDRPSKPSLLVNPSFETQSNRLCVLPEESHRTVSVISVRIKM